MKNKSTVNDSHTSNSYIKQTRLIGQQTIIEYEGTKDKILGDWISIRDQQTIEYICLLPLADILMVDQDILYYLSNLLKMFTDNLTIIILDSLTLKQKRFQQTFSDDQKLSLGQYLIKNKLQNNFYIKMVYTDQPKEQQMIEFSKISKSIVSEIIKLKEQIRNEGDKHIIDIFKDYCLENLSDFVAL